MIKKILLPGILLLSSFPIYSQEKEIIHSTEHLNFLGNTGNSKILKEKKVPINIFKENVEVLKKRLSVPIESNPFVYYHTEKYFSSKYIIILPFLGSNSTKR